MKDNKKVIRCAVCGGINFADERRCICIPGEYGGTETILDGVQTCLECGTMRNTKAMLRFKENQENQRRAEEKERAKIKRINSMPYKVYDSQGNLIDGGSRECIPSQEELVRLIKLGLTIEINGFVLKQTE